MISIIIPTFNRVNFLKKTLPSYLIQKHIDEIIIVDDNSQDDTPKIIDKIRKKSAIPIKYIKHSLNKGLPAAKNTGVRNAIGQFILFGEDDIYLSPNYSKILLNHLKKNNVDIIAGKLINLKEQKCIRPFFELPNDINGPIIDYKIFKGYFFKKTNRDIRVPFVHAVAMIKKEIFRYQNFDESLFKYNYYREETDFYLNAIDKGFEIIYCPHTVVYHLPKAKSDLGGCGRRKKINYLFWIQINNINFINKNKKIIKDTLGINPFIFAINFAIISLRNFLLRTLRLRY